MTDYGPPFPDVEVLLAQVRAMTPELVEGDDLLEAFGPQWREVCALAHQMAAITPTQASGLVDSPVAAWDAAWRAAKAGGKSRASAMIAASCVCAELAWEAAGDAAWSAAGDAADALVARDLITPDGPWDQAAYDLLTGPLRKAGITVHPDDPALEDQ